MTIKTLTPQQAHDLLYSPDTSGSTLLIDVRELSEFATGVIERAQLMPLSTFDSTRIDLTGISTIIFQCRSGVRSKTAAELAKKHISSNITLYSMTGGIIAWVNSEYPVISPKH